VSKSFNRALADTPLYVDTSTIRNTSDQPITTNYKDDIIREVNAGKQMVIYNGHGHANDFDMTG
jgi:hypothetical protein